MLSLLKAVSLVGFTSPVRDILSSTSQAEQMKLEVALRTGTTLTMRVCWKPETFISPQSRCTTFHFIYFLFFISVEMVYRIIFWMHSWRHGFAPLGKAHKMFVFPCGKNKTNLFFLTWFIMEIASLKSISCLNGKKRKIFVLHSFLILLKSEVKQINKTQAGVYDTGERPEISLYPKGRERCLRG